MTDEETKRSDRRKLKLAATAVAAGIVGNRVVDSILPEPAYLEYMPPPAKAAPKEPEKEPEKEPWKPKHHEEPGGPQLRMKTPLERVDEVQLVQSERKEGRGV